MSVGRFPAAFWAVYSAAADGKYRVLEHFKERREDVSVETGLNAREFSPAVLVVWVTVEIPVEW